MPSDNQQMCAPLVPLDILPVNTRNYVKFNDLH